MRLTRRAIQAFKYEGPAPRRDVRWDDEVPGLGLRVYPSGRKAFVLSYRVDGRKRLMTLGDYGTLTLDDARDEALGERRKARKRIDPLTERRRLARGKTVRDLCREYIERHAKPRKKSWRDDDRRIQRRVLPAWGGLKARAVKRADVATLHGRIGRDHPYEANRVLELLGKMFELAQHWGFVPERHTNPARGIDPFPEQERDRWVSPEELPKLAEAIDGESNLYARYALWLYLLTGVRKSELLGARWEDVEWGRKELRLGETKSGRTHYVPLSESAIALLHQIPRVEGNPFILPGHREGRPLVNISKPWRRVREAATVKLWAAHEDPAVSGLIAELTERLGREPTEREVRAAAGFALPPGLMDVRLHDLRRTVGSWLAQAGNSLHLIGRVLNHSSVATTAVYARFGQDQVRTALEEHGQKLMGVAGKRESASVTEFVPRATKK